MRLQMELSIVGCHTCKKRKVKCDRNRPKCSRCANAHLECAGFAPKFRFINEEPRIRRSHNLSDAQIQEYTALAKYPRLITHTHQAFQFCHIALSSINTLPLSAFREDMSITYLHSKLIGNGEIWKGPNAAEEAHCGIPSSWIDELLQTNPTSRPKSWYALAAMILGQAFDCRSTIIRAVELYGTALLELHTRLSSDEHQLTDSTLSSMTALCVYEVCYEPVALKRH